MPVNFPPKMDTSIGLKNP